MTIAELQALAKLNFPDERCYQVYNAIIAPNIKDMIESYFKDWQTIEMQVTALVMKHKGIFKTKEVPIQLDENDTESPFVTDVKEFWRIKRSNFSSKISLLLEEHVISQPMYDLLRHLANRRNKVHDYNGILTEDDRILFAKGASLLHPTYSARCFDAEKDMWNLAIRGSDQEAEAVLEAIKQWQSSDIEDSLFKRVNIDKVKGGWE